MKYLKISELKKTIKCFFNKNKSGSYFQKRFNFRLVFYGTKFY